MKVSRYFNTKNIYKWLKSLILILTAGFFVTIPADYIRHMSQSYSDGERAPYLQMLGSDQVTIRWQTKQPSLTLVLFGTDTNHLTPQVLDTVKKRQHKITLTELEPNQQYYYQVPNSKLINDPVSFYTAPEVGSDKPLAIWVQGDAGSYSDRAKNNFQQIKTVISERSIQAGPKLDLWLTTGDNAYRSGSAQEFQQHLFTPYQDWLAKYNYWPAYGNHDARRYTYDRVFSLPKQGELGGEPSNNGRYFSFDYGQVHVVFLDSTSTHLFRYHRMVNWLEKDLKQNILPWTIVLFHEPPYTKGSHDSDSWIDSVGRMITMRENIVPVLDKYSVDLVMVGHSHVYERSYLLRCHYGYSTELQDEMVLQQGNKFTKTNDKAVGYQGTVYQLIGSTAKLSQGTPLDHPAMPVALEQSGSLYIEITKERLVSKFIDQYGKVGDQFEIIKQGPALYNQACY